MINTDFNFLNRVIVEGQVQSPKLIGDTIYFNIATKNKNNETVFIKVAFTEELAILSFVKIKTTWIVRVEGCLSTKEFVDEDGKKSDITFIDADNITHISDVTHNFWEVK